MPTKLEDEKARRRMLEEEMGDIEFQLEIAPNLNYKGPIDPKLAKIGKPSKKYRGVRIPSLQQFANQHYGGNTEEAKVAYGHAMQETPENKAGIFSAGPENADPLLWGHEYRHEQGISNENINRALDAWNVSSPTQWRQAVRNNKTYRGLDSDKASEADLKKRLKAFEDNDLDKYREFASKTPWWKR